MPDIISQDPYKSFKVLKLVLQTTLRAKCVVTRRGTSEDKTYIMVIAPMKDKQGNPNGVKERVRKLLKMDHPNLIQVLEAYEWEGKCYYIMSDWTKNGADSHISRVFRTKALEEKEVAQVIQKLVSALLYMQKQGVVHSILSFEDLHFSRSLNEESDERDTLDVKIVDFGLGPLVDQNSHRVAMNHQQDQQLSAGSRPLEAKLGHFSEKSDVWTLGSVALSLLTNSLRVQRVLRLCGFFIAGEAGGVSRLGQDFVTNCMKIAPDKRFSFQEAFDHHWFLQEANLNQSCLFDSKITDALNAEDKRNAFQRLACTIVAKHLGDTDGMKEHRVLFDAIDVDGTGFITHEEFHDAFNKNPNFPDVTCLFEKLDIYGDEKISYNEFLAATLSFKDNVDETTLIEAFHSMDQSGNSVITASDLAGAVGITEDSAREMLFEALGHRGDPDPEILQSQFLSLIRQEKSSANPEYMPLVKSFVNPSRNVASAVSA